MLNLTLRNIVPVMASNSQDGWVASATNEFYEAFLAFNHDFSDDVIHAWAGVLPADLQLASPVLQKISGVRIAGRNSAFTQSPSDFTIQTSLNGTDWTIQRTLSGLTWTGSEQKTFNLPSIVEAKYLKIAITNSVQGTYTGITELEILSPVTHYNLSNSLHGDAFAFTVETTTPDETFTLPLVDGGTFDFLCNWGDSQADVNVVPVMTANDAPAGWVASASSEYAGGGFEAYKAFDKTISVWATQQGFTTGNLIIQSPISQTINFYTLRSGNYDTASPQDWTLKTSSDGILYDISDTQTGIIFTGDETKTFIFTTPVTAKYFKLDVTKNGGHDYAGGLLTVAELCLYGHPTNSQNFISSHDDPNATHVYPVPGTYTVQMVGVCSKFSFNNGGDKAKVRKLLNVADLGFVQLDFFGCSGMTEIVRPFRALNSFISARSMFQGCALTSIPNGIFDKCLLINDVYGIFFGNQLTSIPNGIFDKNTELLTCTYAFGNNPTIIQDIPGNIFLHNTKIIHIDCCFTGNTGLSGNGWQQIISNCEAQETPPATTDNCFLNCTSLSDYATIPESWK